MVEEGKLNFTTPVSEVLPEFRTQSDILQHMATISDFMSMRTGMQSSDNWLQSQNDIMFPESDSMKILNSFRLVRPFRADWEYNNWGFEIAGQVISKISGKSWGKFLEEQIFKPLGMKRTGTDLEAHIDSDNFASAYATLDDGTPFRIEGVKLRDGTIMGSAGGARSCVNDLLRLYQAFLRSYNDQLRTGASSTPDSPLKHVPSLMSAHAILPGPTLHGTTYALGWARSELPGPMGVTGLNPNLVDKMPIVGRGSPSRLCIYHQGSLPGALTAVNLFPETDSAIVVLSNALALKDCADWIGQSLVECLFDVEEKNDYLKIAQASADRSRAWYTSIKDRLDEDSKGGTEPRPLQEYVGKYYNTIRTMLIVVSIDGESVLTMSLQGLKEEEFILKFYHDDIFTWLAPRDELIRRGRFTDQRYLYYQIRFVAKDGPDIDGLYWAHDSSVPEGEEFLKAS